MGVSTLEELFEHELEDIYYAEHELLDVLDELAEQTEHEEISEAFREHRRETEEHVDRVEQVFEMIGEPPEEEECEGIQGLIEEHDEFLEKDPDPEILDLFNVTAAEKTEHYEIAAYGNLAKLASELGMDEAGDLLHQNLVEEEQALEKLKELTEQYDFGRVEA
jgi:ferritin-like metal-binding protein YciE